MRKIALGYFSNRCADNRLPQKKYGLPNGGMELFPGQTRIIKQDEIREV